MEDANKQNEQEAAIRGYPNLKPFRKGQSGNPKGRPKGSKNFATVVREIMSNENLLDKVSKNKPYYYDALPEKNGLNAVAMAMLIKALSGDKSAADWIVKTGWGDKIDITSGDERITMAPVIISEIRPRNVDTAEAEAETNTDN